MQKQKKDDDEDRWCTDIKRRKDADYL